MKRVQPGLYLLIVVFAVALNLAPASAPWAADEPMGPVTVASKKDTESLILGHIIAEAVRASGAQVVDKIGSGDTVSLRQAIKMGEIDIYPEYVGLGALMYPTMDKAVWLVPGEAFQSLKETDYVKNGLVWLKNAPADAGWRIVCRRDFALEHRLADMRDFARYAGEGGEVVLACCGPFVERADVLPAMQRVYGFMLEDEQLVRLDACDTASAQAMLAKGERGVNFAMAFGTDPGIREHRLTMLKDVDQSQVVFQPSPVIRDEVITAMPGLKQLLTPIFGALSTSTMQSLNASVTHKGQSPEDAAKAYLQSHGFIE
jgi:osmoprotectant transport system substrate-binding protein